MKRFLPVVSMLIVITFLSSFLPENCDLKYKGIYAIKLDEEHSAVLRFYEDGTVLASTSVNDYMDVMGWFNKDNKDMVLKGTYKVKKCAIKFSVSGMTGEQSYEGEISGDRINFELSNKDSKKTAKRTYTFYAL
jgi:hypothetical protein